VTAPRSSAAGAAGAPPIPPAAVEGAGPQAPADIAAAFKAAVERIEREQQVPLLPGSTLRAPPGAPAPRVVPVPVPTWTPGGIGRTSVHLVNALLGAQEFELLEEEEEQGLAEDVAYYLTVRWPSGSRYEPELRLLGRAAEIWGPRVTARIRAERERELDDEAAAAAAAGERVAP